MAVVYPLANGNWSTITWYSGGVPYGQPPLATDDVYADGKTVTIDQNIIVLSLTNAIRSGGTTGGTFQVTNSGYTITANNLYAVTAQLLSSTTTGVLTINGNIPSTSAALTTLAITGIGSNIIFNGNVGGSGVASSTYGISVSGANTLLNLTGNLTNPTTNINTSAVIVSNNSRAIINGIITGPNANAGIGTFHNNSINATGSIINGTCIYGVGNDTPAISNIAGSITVINGNQTAVGGNSGYYAIKNVANATMTINGDCLGALSASPSNAFIAINVGSGILNINGSVTQRSVGFSGTFGLVHNSSTGTINISTNVSGGTVANTIGISNASTGTINVTGNITGGSNATNTPAIYSTTAGTIDVSGSCSADVYPALFSTSTTAVNRLRGNVLTKNGIVAAYVWKVNISPTAAQQFTFQDTSNANRLIATSNISQGAPGIADVRFGTVYGSSSEFTGTLRVPNPNTVSLGVLTDNTTGTMIMTPADFWGVASSGLTTNGSIGERLKNASTVQSNGDQLAAYIV